MRMPSELRLLSWLLGFESTTAERSLTLVVSFGPGLAGDLAVIHVRLPNNKVKVHKDRLLDCKEESNIKKASPCYLCSFVSVLGSSVVFLSLAT